jgi:HAD superfamily hydrolase (TIGR01549 family)
MHSHQRGVCLLACHTPGQCDSHDETNEQAACRAWHTGCSSPGMVPRTSPWPGFPFTTVLFDVDGTLIHSNAAHAQTWHQALREHDVEATLAHVRSLVGTGSDNLLPALAQISDDSDLGRSIAQRKKELFEAVIPSLRPTNGARALVQYLREAQRTIVIATSADDREVAALLKQAGVDDLIPVGASKDDAADSKPDPDIVEAALRRAGAAADESVMIGDTPYDLEASKRAGVSAIVLRCGGYWSDDDLHGAAAILDDPAALVDYLRASRMAAHQLR